MYRSEAQLPGSGRTSPPAQLSQPVSEPSVTQVPRHVRATDRSWALQPVVCGRGLVQARLEGVD